MSVATNHGFCYSTGRDILVLHNIYDPKQLWFDFVSAVFPPRTAPLPPETPKKKQAQPLQWRIPEAGVPQMSLPFATAKKVTKGLRKRLSNTGWPTFQRTPSGDLLVLDVARDWNQHVQLSTVTDWCNSNLQGLYVPNKQFVFELETDYVLALLGSPYFRKPEKK